MAVSKVVFGERTLIDLTGDTVLPETLFAGETAHNAAGEKIVGTATQGGVQIPAYIETGTFTVEEDSSGPVIITLGGEPADFIYRADEIYDFLNIKINTTVGGNLAGRKETLTVNNKHELVYGVYASGYGISTEGNTVTFTSRTSLYPFRAGLTYRWFAWIKESAETVDIT